MKKRLLSILLALCMVLTLLPVTAVRADAMSLSNPQVTRLTVSWDGGEPVELLGAQPTVSMPAGSKPVFTVSFDSTELLNQVFVTSTKDGETKYLEAKPQGAQYVTDGYFDPEDTNYIPGTIAVTYGKRAVKVDESGNVGGTDLDTLKAQLSSQGISSQNETATDDGTVTAQIVLGDMFDAMADVYFDAAVSEFTAGAGIDQSALNDWLGVYQNLGQLSSYNLEGTDGRKFTLYLGDGEDFGDADTYLMLVKDLTSNKYTKMLLSKAAGKVGLGDISDALSAANIATKKLLEFNAISEETAALREEIETHPTMTQQEKAEANAQIAALDRDKKLFLIGMTAISVMLYPVGAPLMISALVAGYSSISDYFWEYRVGMIEGCKPVEGAFSEDSGHGGGWIPLTNAYIEENGHAITKSGKYYLAEDIWSLIIGEFDVSDPSLNVTLCLHGNYSPWMSVYGGATLNVNDCTYKEHEDGTVSNGSNGWSNIDTRQNSSLIINSGIFKCIDSDGGEIVINGGVVSNDTGYLATYSIFNANGGKITINGGIIKGGVYSSNGGEIIVNDGTIMGNSDVRYWSDYIVGSYGLWTDSGKITVNNGKIAGIATDAGEVIINNSTLATFDGYPEIITNHHGTVTINGGSQAIRDIRNIGGGTVNVNGGEFSRIVNLAGGTVNITGGEITGHGPGSDCVENEGGIVNISGGRISNGTASGLRNTDNGTVYISGGEIQDLDNEGKVIITGGTVKGNVSFAISNRRDGEITISNGTIIKGIANLGKGKVDLLINQNSDILVDGGNSGAFRFWPTTSSIPTSVAAADNYSGGVTYYSASDAQGVRMTIEEAGRIDFSLPYVRLVADGASGNPDEPSTDCEHIYSSVVTPPTCTERGYTTHTCSKCGSSYQDSYTNALGHDFGEWVVTVPATAATSGSREHVCSVCQYKETETIPATGGSSSGFTVGGGSSGGGGSSKPSVRPNSTPSTPATTPTTTTAPSTPSSAFSDVPANHTFAAEISWAQDNGILGGYADGTFRPSANTNRQQMWMVLARMAGANPANMAEARTWAVNSGISDGTNSENPMSRQQLVTMLYRFAQSQGAAISGSADLSTYPDNGAIASYATEALAWAVGNGIVTGTSDGRLNPEGTATRAHFAAFLYRYSSL